MIDIDLEEPQPVTGDIKDFRRILDEINRNNQLLQRNIKALKEHGQEST